MTETTIRYDPFLIASVSAYSQQLVCVCSDLPPSQQCQKEGFGGFFDGDDDWVSLPDLGTFDAVTLDVWVQFDEIAGEHPVVMVKPTHKSNTLHVENSC